MCFSPRVSLLSPVDTGLSVSQCPPSRWAFKSERPAILSPALVRAIESVRSCFNPWELVELSLFVPLELFKDCLVDPFIHGRGFDAPHPVPRRVDTLPHVVLHEIKRVVLLLAPFRWFRGDAAALADHGVDLAFLNRGAWGLFF